jgi:hypothetical protein
MWQVGATYEWRMLCTTVMLPNAMIADRLTPMMARDAARIATGQDHGVWVFSDDEHGYALYPNSHREVTRRDLERYTIEPYEVEA